MQLDVAIGVQKDIGLPEADLSGSVEGISALATIAGDLQVGASVVVDCSPDLDPGWPARRDRLRVLHSTRDTLLVSLTADALVIEAGGVGWENLVGALDAAAEAARSGDATWHQHFEHLPGFEVYVAAGSVALIVSAPRAR